MKKKICPSTKVLVGAIPFCGEHPGPRFEDKFDQPIKWMEFQKLAEIKWLPIDLQTSEHAKYGVTYTGKSACSDCLYFCEILGNKRRHWYLQAYSESFPYLVPFSRYSPEKLVLLKQ